MKSAEWAAQDEQAKLAPDPKLAGLMCPLCGVGRSMIYAPRHNSRVERKFTAVWECEACPAVLFEQHGPEDAKVL